MYGLTGMVPAALHYKASMCLCASLNWADSGGLWTEPPLIASPPFSPLV